MVLIGDKPSLLATDNQKLLVLGLEQPNADGQVQTHAPELDLAGVCAVQGINDEDHEQEYVERQKRHEQQWHIANLDHGVVAVKPKEEASCPKEDGVCDDENNVGYSIAVEVFGSVVDASRIKIHHYADCAVDDEG